MTEPDNHLCVIGSEPHRSAVGLLVCEGHAQKLRDALVAIVDTVARIHITPARTGNQIGGGRSGNLASHRSLLDLEALALAGPQAPGDITEQGGSAGWDPNHPLGVIGSWARMIREERKLTPPSGPAVLTAEVSTVLFWLDWACTQQWIDEMYSEITASHGRVAAADPDRVRPGDEGRCPAIGFGPGDMCGGQLRRERGAMPWVRLEDRCERAQLDVHAGVVKCQKCGNVWATEVDEARLHVMRENATRQAIPFLTAAGLSVRHGITKRAAQERIKRAGVKPVMNGGIGWYPADILDQPEIVSA